MLDCRHAFCFRLFVSSLLLLSCLHLAILPQCFAETQYEWDDWDYYQILDLSSDSSNQYSSKDIRKAYRKQAQLWHPDKVLHREENSTDKATTNSSASKLEESNARFARIAEAYQTLSDEGEKATYDRYLLQQTRHSNRQRQEERPHSQDGAEWEWIDPFRMFQDFFFGEEEERDEDYGDYNEFDPFFQMRFAPRLQYWRHAVEGYPPDRVQKDEERFLYGRDEILRILELTSYFVSDGAYVRAMALDCVVQGGSYRPLTTEPYLLHDDLLDYRMDPMKIIDESKPFRMIDPMTLWPDVRMVAGSRMRNGDYIAEVDSSCSFSIAHLKPVDYSKAAEETIWESELLWSAEEDPHFVDTAPYFRATDCHLSFHGLELVLEAEGPQRVTLWRSGTEYPSAGFSGGVPGKSHAARLDSDGSLAIYLLEPVVFEAPWVSRLWRESMLSSFANTCPEWRKFVITLAPDSLWTIFWSIVAGGRIWRLSSTQVARAVCQSAIGSPVGCHRVGRRLFQLFRDAKHLFQSVASYFDRLLDEFM